MPDQIAVHMGFAEAIDQVKRGGRVTKLAWADNLWWVEMRNDTLMLHKPDDHYYQWIISYGDLLDNDWVVID